MTPRQTIYVQAMSGGLVLAAIICVTVLGFHGTLDGQSVVAVLGTAIGFAGANVSGVGAVAQAVNGKATVSDATLRQAISGGQNPDVPREPLIPPGDV